MTLPAFKQQQNPLCPELFSSLLFYLRHPMPGDQIKPVIYKYVEIRIIIRFLAIYAQETEYLNLYRNVNDGWAVLKITEL